MTFEGGETVLIKALNLCSVRDDAADAKEAATVVAPPSDSRQERTSPTRSQLDGDGQT